MRQRQRRCAWLLTALLLGAWLGSAQATPEQPSVLILLPGQPGLPAAAAIASGIRAGLLTEWAFRVSIEMEHVDVARFASPDVEGRRLRAVYGSKYRDQRFDVIVAALPEPFQFVLHARDELWPGTPVVVCGVDERSVRGLKPPPGFAVLTTRFDMEGTVRAALALLPDTHHVALIGGASQPEQVYHDLIRQAVARARGVDVIDLTKLPIADALARVSSLPEHTVIIQSSYQVDGAGRRFYGIDLVSHVSSAANRPVFTPLGLALGRGSWADPSSSSRISVATRREWRRGCCVAGRRRRRRCRASRRPRCGSTPASSRAGGSTSGAYRRTARSCSASPASGSSTGGTSRARPGSSARRRH